MKRGDCLAIVAFPLDNTEYTASAMGAFLATRTRGVYSADDSLAVTANGNMTVTVGPGLAWLKAADYWGLAVCSEAAATLTVPTASSSAKRMDAVCLRLDKTGNKAELIVKPGTPAAMPVLPPLQRNDSYDEIYLAGISLAAGAVAVSAADITDLRLNEDYCGLMRDGVTGIPTAQLSAQADALMAQLREAIQAASSGEGVSVYTHQKSGTIHKLTGSGPNGRVKLTANVAAGDTVQVNGKTVPAYVGGEAFADALAGEALSGRWLSFVWDGAQVNFKGGGGLTGAKLALADAEPADVRRGRTFYARGRGLQTGTAEYPQYLGVVSATIGANAVLADYTLTPGVWRIVAAAWRDNREYGYIAVQVGGTEHGGTEPTYGHGRVLDVTLTLTENTSCRVLTRSNYVVGGCWAIVRQP